MPVLDIVHIDILSIDSCLLLNTFGLLVIKVEILVIILVSHSLVNHALLVIDFREFLVTHLKRVICAYDSAFYLITSFYSFLKVKCTTLHSRILVFSKALLEPEQ